MDYEKWYYSCKYLIDLGFDLEKNSAKDLLEAINEFYAHYEEYVSNISE